MLMIQYKSYNTTKELYLQEALTPLHLQNTSSQKQQ